MIKLEDREFVVESLRKAGDYVAKRLHSKAEPVQGDFDVGFKVRDITVKCYLHNDKLVVVAEVPLNGKNVSTRGELQFEAICSQRIGLAHCFTEAIIAVMRG